MKLHKEPVTEASLPLLLVNLPWLSSSQALEQCYAAVLAGYPSSVTTVGEKTFQCPQAALRSGIGRI